MTNHKRYLSSCIKEGLRQKMFFLSGPWQMGKTTLAINLLKNGFCLNQHFKKLLLIGLTLSMGFLSVSCSLFNFKAANKVESLAVMNPVNNSKVKGWVRFQKIKGHKTLVTAQIQGLKPSQKHGFHIHSYGDCRQNGKNAGPHWNPTGHPHAEPNARKKHWGDLGNLVADKKGHATYRQVFDLCLYKGGSMGDWACDPVDTFHDPDSRFHRTQDCSYRGGSPEVITTCLYNAAGRAVIIHAKEDDLKSQPSGNAGPFVACGRIGYVKPTK